MSAERFRLVCEVFEAARNAFRRVTELEPDSADAHAMHGFVLKELGEFAAARTALERSLALRPDQPRVQGVLRQIPVENQAEK